MIYYSPAALLNSAGTVVERYEYDAYGKPRILDADFAVDADQKSDVDNPYLFTGRNADRLDNGSLWLQYNRNRYYSYSLGRWMTRDPLGVVPNAFGMNPFNITGEYKDGMNIYEYVRSNPLLLTDSWGLEDLNVFSYKNNRTSRYDIPYSGHAGILIGSDDLDFGPNGLNPFYTKGACPWGDGGPGIDSYGRVVKYTKTRLHKQTTGYMLVAEKKKCCNSATWDDIKQCLHEQCAKWDGTVYSFGVRDCGSFVSEAKSKCCLR